MFYPKPSTHHGVGETSCLGVHCSTVCCLVELTQLQLGVNHLKRFILSRSTQTVLVTCRRWASHSALQDTALILKAITCFFSPCVLTLPTTLNSGKLNIWQRPNASPIPSLRPLHYALLRHYPHQSTEQPVGNVLSIKHWRQTFTLFYPQSRLDLIFWQELHYLKSATVILQMVSGLGSSPFHGVHLAANHDHPNLGQIHLKDYDLTLHHQLLRVIYKSWKEFKQFPPPFPPPWVHPQGRPAPHWSSPERSIKPNLSKAWLWKKNHRHNVLLLVLAASSRTLAWGSGCVIHEPTPGLAWVPHDFPFDFLTFCKT